VANLLERTSELGSRIQAYKTLHDQAKAVSELQARATEISTLLKELGSLAESRQVLLTLGIKLRRPPRPSAALLNKAANLRKMFTEDALSLARESTLFGQTFSKPLREFNARLEAALMEAWRSYVNDKLPTINERILETFGAMGFSSDVAKIKGLLARAKLLGDALPSHRDKMAQVDSLSADLKAVWRNLEDIPADVRKFFRLAANSEATLEDLTEPIRAWLKNHGLIQMLRLGLAK
jgi:hypothetical protein